MKIICGAMHGVAGAATGKYAVALAPATPSR